MSVPHPTRDPRPSRARHERGLPPRFTSLYRSHYDFIWRCAQRLGADPAELDDVVQETFLVALRRLDGFDIEGSAQPSTWLFGILRNVLRNHARGQLRRTRKREAFGEVHRDACVDEAATEQILALELLDRFLHSLDPDRRAVFVLSELEGHDSRAIADALGINQNTARTRLRAARRVFAETFEADSEQGKQIYAAIEAGRSSPPSAGSPRRERSLQAIALVSAAELGGAGAKLSVLGLSTWVSKLSVGALALSTAALVVVIVPATEAGSTRARATESAFVSRTAAEFRPRGHDQGVTAKPFGQDGPTKPSPASTEPALVTDAEEPAVTVQGVATERRASEPRAMRRTSELGELQAVADAREALLDSRAADALALVRGRASWRDPVQARRARALEIGALCALERSDEARSLARTWAKAHPDEPLGDHVGAPCW